MREKFAEYQRTRDVALRDELVESHLGLARYLARRFEHRGESFDDLFQVASLALIKAVERYDPERGFEFTTFAVPTIVGELKRHFRDRAWAVRVPRRLQELGLLLAGSIAELTQQLGRAPSVKEVGVDLGASEEEVLEAMDASRLYRLTSLEAVAGPTPDGTGPLAAALGDLDSNLANVEQQAEVAALLKGLSERERTIVVLRFYEGLTQTEIAERTGISQMHVSRLLAKTLRRLSDAADADEG
jgi:RNA polymerase sigma-B factor